MLILCILSWLTQPKSVQAYVELIAVGDAWKAERIKLTLFSPTASRTDGLLVQATDFSSNPQLQPSRRFAMIKFIILLLQHEPLVRYYLPPPPHP